MDKTITIDYLEDGNKTENSIGFNISGNKKEGLNKSIINSLRRTLLSSIPTVGFRTEMDNTDIKIIKNTTPLHNEFLLHRIAMIPLYINPEGYNKKYLFRLKVESSPDIPITNVTSKDFDIFPLKDSISIDNDTNEIDITNYTDKPISENEKKKIFKPFEGKYYTLITELKSTKSSLKQELELYGVPRVSFAYEDARWQAVSKAVYSFKRDDDLFKSILNEKIKLNNISEEEKYNFSNTLYISESERYFHRDIHCEPYWYEFYIDSVHYFSSKDLFIKSCEIIITQLELLIENIPKLISNEKSYLEIEELSENIYKLNIYGSDDTIGNLLQTYITNNIIDDNSDIEVCGYKKTHPLENNIYFNISFKIKKNKSKEQNINSIIEIFTNTSNALINTLLSIKESAIQNL